MSSANLKTPIQGALDQLSTEVNSDGEVEHYLWGFEGWYDSWVWITKETYDRIRRFLLEGTENELYDIEGLMASGFGDHGIAFGERRDEESIPFGTPVSVALCFQDRTCDESAWFFDIARAA